MFWRCRLVADRGRRLLLRVPYGSSLFVFVHQVGHVDAEDLAALRVEELLAGLGEVVCDLLGSGLLLIQDADHNAGAA